MAFDGIARWHSLFTVVAVHLVVFSFIVEPQLQLNQHTLLDLLKVYHMLASP